MFSLVEWVLEEGDEEARSLIVDGFLDDLTNPDFYVKSPNEPRDFVPWLGPGALKQPPVELLLDF